MNETADACTRRRFKYCLRSLVIDAVENSFIARPKLRIAREVKNAGRIFKRSSKRISVEDRALHVIFMCGRREIETTHAFAARTQFAHEVLADKTSAACNN